MRDLAAECFSPAASARHYLSMATGQLVACQGETVPLKKYLYTVRALLAARWVVAERRPAPMRLKDLVDAGLEGPVRGPLKDVLADKAVSGERDGHPRVPELDAWLQTALTELTDVVADLATAPKVPWERLNEVFLAVVRSAQAG